MLGKLMSLTFQPDLRQQLGVSFLEFVEEIHEKENI